MTKYKDFFVVKHAKNIKPEYRHADLKVAIEVAKTYIEDGVTEEAHIYELVRVVKKEKAPIVALS